MIFLFNIKFSHPDFRLFPFTYGEIQIRVVKHEEKANIKD